MKRVFSPNTASSSTLEGMTAVGAFPNGNAQLYRAASHRRSRESEAVKPRQQGSPRRVAQIMNDGIISGSHISGAKDEKVDRSKIVDCYERLFRGGEDVRMREMHGVAHG